MSKRVKACAVVDNKQDVQRPLDFSFKGIGCFHGKCTNSSMRVQVSTYPHTDTLREKPRSRGPHGAVSSQ